MDVQLREGRGKGAARATRRAGLVPAIIYGHKIAPMAIQLSERELRHLLSSGSENAFINMDLGEDVSETVMIKEIQIDPVSRRIVHTDFIRVSLEERVTTHVPINLLGIPIGVQEGGIQEFALRELEVECEVGKLPEHMDIDVSSLAVGEQVRVRDIEPDEDMIIFDDPSTIIVTIVAPTVIEEVEEEEEEVELLEEEEMEPEVIGEKGKAEEEEEEEE